MAADQTHVRKLKPAERWFHDGLLVCQRPVIHASLDVDVSSLSSLLEEARQAGLRLTYAHLFVRATALVLRDNSRLHRLLCGSCMHTPETVDIALSVSSEDAVTPVLILKASDQKSLSAISTEIIQKTPEAHQQHEALLSTLNRWGWIMPFGAWRRTFLRAMGRSSSFRRAGSGTFQVSVLRGVDRAATTVFNTNAMLMAGEVKERVALYEGKPAARLLVTLTCCADHRVWNGSDCQVFLHGLANILTTGQLANEWRESAAFVS